MKIESLVALNVIDNEMYEEYRIQMKPVLHSYGGNFGYDFIINNVLKSEVEHPINRVFTINFPNKESMSNFFSDEKYLKIKENFFTPSVSDVTILASFEANLDLSMR